MKLHTIDIEPNYEPLTGEEETLLRSRVLAQAGEDQTERIKITGRKKISKRRVFAISLVAVFVFGITFTFAGVALGWDSPLVKWFNPKNDKQAELVSSAGMVVDKSVTKNGVTVTIKEIVGDRNTAYMAIDVSAPEIINDDAIAYGFYDFVADLSISGCSFSRKEISRQEDTIHYLVILDSGEKIHGKKLTLNMTDFGYFDNEGLFTKLVDGLWQIEFNLEYNDSSIDLNVEEKLNSKIGEVSLNKVYLSPISLSFEIESEYLRLLDEKGETTDYFKDGLEDAINTMIKMKDGKVYNPSWSEGIRSAGTVKITFEFDRILELDQVESLSIGECIIDIGNL